MENGMEMPPLDLYKLKTDYYVLDGHHRVAAARQLGQLYLDAIVTEFVPARDTDYTRAFMARQQFERDTGLTGVAATTPEAYRKMWRMVQEYHKNRNSQEGRKGSVKEAANSWYLNVYVPITEKIRASGLPRAFPDRRAGDLFVYLHDYRERENGRGRDLTLDEALAEFRRDYLQRGRRFPSLATLLHLPSRGPRGGDGDKRDKGRPRVVASGRAEPSAPVSTMAPEGMIAGADAGSAPTGSTGASLAAEPQEADAAEAQAQRA
jgi:hypothetical protein